MRDEIGLPRQVKKEYATDLFEQYVICHHI